MTDPTQGTKPTNRHTGPDHLGRIKGIDQHEYTHKPPLEHTKTNRRSWVTTRRTYHTLRLKKDPNDRVTVCQQPGQGEHTQEDILTLTLVASPHMTCHIKETTRVKAERYPHMLPDNHTGKLSQYTPQTKGHGPPPTTRTHTHTPTSNGLGYPHATTLTT
ncbi:Hypothetical predicted protein [Pelobates cultripes]|uniref:Uncharacterized protein n=1 Tax=Pelobates cultripes TaxID=61616 RepID=A0AAD1VK48_PELCU|nr:Hypothetical predicted protein [Pelobates cultripes]